VEQRLKLEEFRILFRHWQTGLPWLDHLLLGVLVWIEGQMIDARVKVEVDEAIKEYETLQPVETVSPVYTESISETSTSLPEMRLTAPWYTELYDEK